MWPRCAGGVHACRRRAFIGDCRPLHRLDEIQCVGSLSSRHLASPARLDLFARPGAGHWQG